jgi:thymidylate synthase (FAD)
MNRDELLAKHREPVPVLDHGFVRLVDVMGDDEAIEQAARVSFDGRGRSERRALIRYLVRHRHTSPLEQAVIKLELKLPIFVARQLVRHRTQSISEVSARYAALPSEVYLPTTDQVREQSRENRQGRGDRLDERLALDWIIASSSIMAAAHDTYQGCLDLGISRELARTVLPVGTYTRWVTTMNAHNLLHLLALRLDRHAQWEVRQYAEAIARIVADWLPLTWEAFTDYRIEAATLSRAEVAALRDVLTPELVRSVCDASSYCGSSTREVEALRALLGGAP